MGDIVVVIRRENSPIFKLALVTTAACLPILPIMILFHKLAAYGDVLPC